LKIVAELRRQCGVSILLVEQNARAALQVADYAYVLETAPWSRSPARPPRSLHDRRVIDDLPGRWAATRPPEPPPVRY
jgi:branched-chain amino acid transport system ATP-binding protein